MEVITPTREHAAKVLAIVDQGLSEGLGIAEPGKMCVEAAVCFALGLPHSDDPKCVGSAVRAYKISLNDTCGLEPLDRAKLLRRLAIAQLGSNTIEQAKFSRLLAEKTTCRIVPIALRAAASVHPDQQHKDALESAAVRCESEGSQDAAYAADADTAASVAVYAAASAAARAAAYAAARAAADADTAASVAVYAAASAAARATARAAASAAASAAYAADAARDAGDAGARKQIFQIAADIGVESLQECGSPGCEWLDLCD